MDTPLDELRANSIYCLEPHHGTPVLMQMPVLQPLPIKTKNAGNFIFRLFIWIFSTRQWKVCENWQYTLRDGTTIVIPEGFIFDGASVPRLFWMLLSPTGLLFIPGLIHDYGYKYNNLIAIDNEETLRDYNSGSGKLFWDKVFRETSIDVNGFVVINYLAWFMLVIGGWFPWWQHRKSERKLINKNANAENNYNIK